MGITEQELADIALTVAKEAAELARTVRADAVREVTTKSTATDVVTAGDTAAEALVRSRLAELRPEDAVFGEEAGGTAGAGVTWVVDPIDGTVNYLYGHPWHCVSVAAQVDGESVAGAVVEPVSGRCWTAARGRGAWLDGVPLRVSEPASLDLTLLATGFTYDRERRVRHAAVVAELLGVVRDIRRGGSAALDLCAVAAGWVDAYVERGLSPWDWAAGALIAREAGAVVLLPGQHELGDDAIFVASPAIAAPLRAACARAGMG
ncbi:MULTISPECIES: inositol monophosphatase family protein [Actinokineospora]|uniref:Inositol-1-monophosphatase n=1 Tax=Actinokineospora fastidiosa TaxID=1816 RepID=A0A918GPZ1_9PSEU|nr:MULTISPECIES: inositol monophosphatase family protein [Actinokineospora]UVS77969.1 Inositol-1-monophosphatase [Actinokineospora sp. UTMC 2448]GGS50735.1 inositol monophosphatase [Actinokineospora fastidiosa]